MGMSLKQIRYLYAIGVFKKNPGDSLTKSRELSGTNRQTIREIGKMSTSLKIGETSSTHRLRIGDETYALKRDRNGSVYPVIGGKLVGSSQLPPGKMSIERISKLGAKKQSTSKSDKTDTSQIEESKPTGDFPTNLDGLAWNNEVAKLRQPSQFVNPKLIDRMFQLEQGSSWGTSTISEITEAVYRQAVMSDKSLRSPAITSVDDPRLIQYEKDHGNSWVGRDDMRIHVAQRDKNRREEKEIMSSKAVQDRVKEIQAMIPEVTKQIQKMVDESDVLTRTTSRALAGILDAGRFKTQIETNTSKGYKDSDTRKDIDEHLFGVERDSDPALRPIYGFVGKFKGMEKEDDNAILQYGDVVIKFKDAVKDRTTITIGDSMDTNGAGRYAGNLPMDIKNVQLIGAYPSTVPRMIFGIPQGVVQETTSTGRRDGNYVYSTKPVTKLQDLTYTYVESQIHGGTKATDIDRVLFTGAKPPSASLINRLKKLGISYEIVRAAKDFDPNG